jgi:hypothetical protein
MRPYCPNEGKMGLLKLSIPSTYARTQANLDLTLRANHQSLKTSTKLHKLDRLVGLTRILLTILLRMRYAMFLVSALSFLFLFLFLFCFTAWRITKK